ncbi:hypothetical protein BC936DRAFT_146118 [Jimgerdemannia flammicorona]|uniref:Uncharacterized protein n=1 Tax=Jimgerdemannia flammicorona TaxID=994334 RepID=A0A433D8F8_9FUNG|nr:hypothetical protein BC936DRAFT_146118 [Jimgerdemannia flammicorona]
MDEHTSTLAKHDGTKYELKKRKNRKSDDLNQLRSALTKIRDQKSRNAGRTWRRISGIRNKGGGGEIDSAEYQKSNDSNLFLLRSLIDRVPAQKLELERNIEDSEQQCDRLRDMRPQWDTLEKAEAENNVNVCQFESASEIRQLEQDLRISGSTKTIDDCQRECGELQIRSVNSRGLNKENLAMEREISVKANGVHSLDATTLVQRS